MLFGSILPIMPWMVRTKKRTNLLVLASLPILGQLLGTSTDSMAAAAAAFSCPSSTNYPVRTIRSRTTLRSAVKIWIEPAEEGFVDQEENLEEGESCLVSVQAFASHAANDNDDDDPLFLCAGALVRRPCNKDELSSSSLPVCDAWMGGRGNAATTSSDMDNKSASGGPNLEIQGAIQVLDHLLLHHLHTIRQPQQACAAAPWGEHSRTTTSRSSPTWASSFVVQCGTTDHECTCAPHQAANLRGFRPFRDIYATAEHSNREKEDEEEDGMVLDVPLAVERYTHCVQLMTDENSAYCNPSVGTTVAFQILTILTRTSPHDNDNDNLYPD